MIALIDMDGTLADYNKAMYNDMELIRSPDEPEYIPHKINKPYMRIRENMIRRFRTGKNIRRGI